MATNKISRRQLAARQAAVAKIKARQAARRAALKEHLSKLSYILNQLNLPGLLSFATSFIPKGLNIPDITPLLSILKDSTNETVKVVEEKNVEPEKVSEPQTDEEKFLMEELAKLVKELEKVSQQ